MNSGGIDTAAFAQHAHLSFGTINEADWWTANLNPGTVNCTAVANIDTCNDLSDAHRILEQSIPEAMAHYLANYGDRLERCESVLAAKGGEKVVVPDEELAALLPSMA